ncbi:hypothetical protein [Brevibacillus borstelensis]|uniref:hypothetical protein n=1 Tax=Brevibacillus borstelensis TaxID=45462 RepID=UPI0030EF608B
MAEQLFENGKRKESVPFYEFVIENEKDSHSDRFLISQYRLFRASQGTDAEENWKAVIRFEPYRKRLPENFQLDGLLQLANLSFTLHRWKEVEKYADELRELAMAVYQDEIRKRESKNPTGPFKTERSLVVYYGQGFLLKSVALEMQKSYEQAKKFVKGYENLRWFELLDDVGREEVEKFETWAKANLYTLEILMGNTDILDEYVTYLANHPNEILPGLIAILEASNSHHFCVDHILDTFSGEIASFRNGRDAVSQDRHFQFRYHKMLYEFRKNRMEQGIEEALCCLSLLKEMNRPLELDILNLIQQKIGRLFLPTNAV